MAAFGALTLQRLFLLVLWGKLLLLICLIGVCCAFLFEKELAFPDKNHLVGTLLRAPWFMLACWVALTCIHSILFKVQVLFDSKYSLGIFDTLVGENGRVLVYFCLGHAGDDVIAFPSFWWPRPIQGLYHYSLLLHETKEIFMKWCSLQLAPIGMT